MYLTLQIGCDSDRLWDEVRVTAHSRTEFHPWYHRPVYQGQSHAIALAKAIVELEALAVKAGWLEPGEFGLSDLAGAAATPPETGG